MRQTNTTSIWPRRIAAFSLKFLTGSVVSISVFLGLCSFLAPAQSANHPILRSLSSTERQGLRSKLDAKLFPTGATEVLVDESQLFKISSVDEGRFTLVPVEFQTPSEGLGGGTVSNCAMYVLSDQGTGAFLWTVGREDELRGLVQCTKLKAIAAQPVTHKMPLLILLYATHTVHDSIFQPYILSFDPTLKTYGIDESWSRKLAEHADVRTIRQIKGLIAQNP